MLSQLRGARYGYLLAPHLLLLCAAGRTPTEIAAFLFCSRSSVYRIVTAYRSHSLGFDFTAEAALQPPIRTTILSPSLKRSLLPCSRRLRTPSADVARAGVVRVWPPNSRSIVAWRSRQRPCAVTCTNSAGSGNAPNSLPKMMTRSASRNWRAFAEFLSISAQSNCCCLLMNSTSTC